MFVEVGSISNTPNMTKIEVTEGYDQFLNNDNRLIHVCRGNKLST